ncbi:MAG: zinc ribbon domain-containing protein [Acidimicrobiia bacterium]
MSETLDALLQLSGRDAAASRLRGRRESLPERKELAEARRSLAALDAEIAERTAVRDSALADEQRVDAEVTAVEDRAQAGEQKLYSGEITSPRELQALQGEIDHLRERRRLLEDDELVAMERRETLDAEVQGLVARRTALIERARETAAALAASEAAIDAELRTETEARDALAVTIPDAVLKAYERARVSTGSSGAARLVGTACEGCHLTIPTTEAEAIRRAPDSLATCDNCGRILVP